MTTKNQKYTIATLVNVKDLQKIRDELTKAGFSEENITVIVQDPKDTASIFPSKTKKKYGNYVGAGIISGAVTGSVLGSLIGISVATGLVAIPLVAPIMLSEAILTVFATALAGSGIGITSGGIFGGLVGIGISKQPLENNSSQSSQITYLILIQGNESDIQNANKILNKHHQKWTSYSPFMAEDNQDNTLNYSSL